MGAADLSSLMQCLEVLPAGAYLCDATGLITYFNRHAAELWGREPALNDPRDRFCGSFRLYSMTGEPIRHDECWMALALRDNQEYNGCEIQVERPNGQRIAALAHANPIRDASGAVIGGLNVLVDTSDRKNADLAIGRLAAIVESSDDAIVSKTLDGRIVTWNGGAERLFGYTAEEAIGSPITLIVPPERRAETRLILSKLRAGERIEHFETVRVAKDGRKLDISLTVSPIRDRQGELIGASKIARDITARKLADRALAEARNELASQIADLRLLNEAGARLSKTFELEPILNETVATAARLAGTNRATIYLVDEDGDWLEPAVTLNPADRPLLSSVKIGSGDPIDRARSQRVFLSADEGSLGAGSGPFSEWRALHAIPLITRSGKEIGVLGLYFTAAHEPSDRENHLLDLWMRQAVDFMENSRLYGELREADRRKDEFLATLAHELRNPLAPLSNSLQLLRLSEEVDPVASRLHGIMERQVSQLIRLVDDLLEVSRVTRGKIELRKELVNVVSIVAQALETSRPVIEAAGHRLAVSVAPETMLVHVDPCRVAQVLSNLLNNAAKYTDKDGQIWLTAVREGNQVVIRIRDTGVGIAREMLPKVFDMFAQVDRTLHRAQGGLGIGLALAQSLARMHGGRIEARSDGIGRGSEFSLRLPLAVAADDPAPEPAAGMENQPIPRRRILVVDDVRATRYTLGKLLEKLGQEVHTARDGWGALDQAKQTRFDAIISDISMPEMDGYELARRLRQLPHKQMVLIALTGHGQDSDRQQAKEAGFDHHLIKPVDLRALVDLLRRLPRPEHGSGRDEEDPLELKGVVAG